MEASSLIELEVIVASKHIEDDQTLSVACFSYICGGSIHQEF